MRLVLGIVFSLLNVFAYADDQEAIFFVEGGHYAVLKTQVQDANQVVEVYRQHYGFDDWIKVKELAGGQGHEFRAFHRDHRYKLIGRHSKRDSESTVQRVEVDEDKNGMTISFFTGEGSAQYDQRAFFTQRAR